MTDTIQSYKQGENSQIKTCTSERPNRNQKKKKKKFTKILAAATFRIPLFLS